MSGGQVSMCARDLSGGQALHMGQGLSCGTLRAGLAGLEGDFSQG